MPGSARVSRVGFGVSPKRSFTEKSAIARTRSPTRETRALPGKMETASGKCRAERAEYSRYPDPPSPEVISGSFFRRSRSQLFQVLRMLSRGVR